MRNKTIHCFFIFRRILVGLAALFLMYACASTTRYIPDGQYLLEKVEIEMEDQGPATADLLPFVQQLPAGNWGVKLYNSVDTTSSWWRNFIRKMGEPGVVMKKNLIGLTENELLVQMKNLGYLNAEVSSQLDTLDKKASLIYKIKANEPYRIRNYTINLPNPREQIQRSGRTQRQGNRSDRNNQGRPRSQRNREAGSTQLDDSTRRVMRLHRRSLLKEDAVFDMNVLEQERQRVSRMLLNQGYYTSSLSNLHYWADTTLRSNQVDLSLGLLDTTSMTPYFIERVNIYSGYDPMNRRSYKVTDSVEYKGFHIYYDKMHFLRPGVITDKLLVRPGGTYRINARENTYNQLRALACVGRVELQYEEGNYADSTLLDCNIYITPGNIHSLQAGLEGTNKAGDLGAAIDLTYGHLNTFNGSETFNVNLRAAYEFVNGDNAAGLDANYYELGLKPSLTFPKMHLPFINSWMNNRYTTQTQYSIGYNIQRRSTYIRNFFNFNWQFRWAGQQQKISHTLSLLDINYINMPWKSDKFQDYLNNVDSLTRYSYSDIFTAGIKYGLIYSNKSSGKARQHLYTLRFNLETSGNLLNALNKTFDWDKNEAGQYTILGNPFAQYVKADVDLSETFHLDQKSSVAFRIGAGLAYPYGNSEILPFEKRYYAGGPNSVRGWKTRYLGPGAFNKGVEGDPSTHVGDINFITSVEYRFKAMKWLEPALFVDAGNIWTIKDYPNQPGGLFQWNSFYKELAVGAGIGFRIDLSFLVLRLDFATKLLDPAYGKGSKWMLGRESFFPNSAWYFAIGYPF